MICLSPLTLPTPRASLQCGPPCIALLLALAIHGCGATSSSATVRTAAQETPDAYVVALRFEDGGTDGEDTPHTQVALVRITPTGDRSVVDLGHEVGACYYVEDPNALIAGSCWWAGAGGNYRIRRDGDSVVAYRHATDEDTGATGAQEVGRVGVPAGAALRALETTSDSAPGSPAQPAPR